MDGQAVDGLSCTASSLKQNRRSIVGVRVIITKTCSHIALLDLCFAPSPQNIAFWIPSKTPLTKDNSSLPVFSQEVLHWPVQSVSNFFLDVNFTKSVMEA